MSFSNNMTRLLNKIEVKLGTEPMKLPDYMTKDKWASKVIDLLTLDTFSRYLPHKFPIILSQSNMKDGYYLIDESIVPGDLQIIGVRDILWQEFGPSSASNTQSFGIYDFFANTASYALDDIAMVQMRADQVSLFNLGIYVEFVPPNKVKLNSSAGADVTKSMPSFKIEVFLKHPLNLSTIPPTQMETFEALATADVANYLYNQLKFYDQLDTVYASIDLKLTDLQNEASKRDDVIAYLKDSYVSAANANQPIMYTVP